MLAQQPLHRPPLSSRIKGDPQLPSHSGLSEPLLILIPSLTLLAAPPTPLPQALGAAAVTSPSPALGPALGRAQQLCPSPAGWLGGGRWKGRVGMVPREPSALRRGMATRTDTGLTPRGCPWPSVPMPRGSRRPEQPTQTGAPALICHLSPPGA